MSAPENGLGSSGIYIVVRVCDVYIMFKGVCVYMSVCGGAVESSTAEISSQRVVIVAWHSCFRAYIYIYEFI